MTADLRDTTPSRYDLIVVGAGSGGVNVAVTMATAGRRVLLVADGFVGGECAYVACMPSKSLLRSAVARHEALTTVDHGATVAPLALADPRDDWSAALARRDSVAAQRDDHAEADKIISTGVTLVRGRGVLAGPGRVHVGPDTFEGDEIVLGTGSAPTWPAIDGLSDVPTWTSDEALSSNDRPERLVIIGGGAVGCELAQIFARFGVAVVLTDPGSHPLPHEDAAIGEAIAAVLAADGVSLRLGVSAVSAKPDGAGLLLQLDDGSSVGADRALVVTGRHPQTADLGLDSLGIKPGEHGEVLVDDRCRVSGHVWAVGDVTGIAPFTHTANYQARIVTEQLFGRSPYRMRPDALPRAVYTDPPFAAVGLTETQARERGHNVITAEVDLCVVSRAGAEGEGPLGPKNSAGGVLRLVADRTTRTLLGAAAVGPAADSWISEATLAVRAAVPIEVLADVVRAFPTYAEAYTAGYQDLLEQLGD